MMIVMFSCYGMDHRTLLERASNLDRICVLTSGLSACFYGIGCWFLFSPNRSQSEICIGFGGPCCLAVILFLLTRTIMIEREKIYARIRQAPPRIPQQINEQINEQEFLEAGLLENTGSGLRLRLNISHESELNPLL